MTHYIRLFLLFFLIMVLPGASFAAASNDFTVVIDPGHGGNDCGAIDNGVKEKDINLGVALKLGELIKSKMKGVKVVYTRDKDNFITLQGRADKANSAKGDIFVSIHTNSVDANNKNRTTVAGASTYVLGLHKDKENMAVARRENSVMSLEKNQESYNGFDPESDESYIIFEMAQKKDLSRSIRLASEVQKQLKDKADRRDRGVHQAGFWVLWATSMPAILVELDFICNPNSAKYISSAQGQEKLAEGIFQAIKNYRDQEKKLSSEIEAAEKEDVANSSNAADYEIAALGSIRTERVMNASGVRQQSASSSKRRRRSKAARTYSDNREIAEAVVTESVVAVIQPEPAKTVADQIVEPTPSKQEAKKDVKGNKKTAKVEKDKKKEDKKIAKSTKVVQPSPQQKAMAAKANRNIEEGNEKKDAEAAAKRINDKFDRSAEKAKKTEKSKTKKADTEEKRIAAKVTKTAETTQGKSNKKSGGKRNHGRLDKKDSESTIYKIMLLSADKPLKESDLRLQMYENASLSKENGKYNYYLGESRNMKELEPLLKTVKNSFPDACIIMSSK